MSANLLLTDCESHFLFLLPVIKEALFASLATDATEVAQAETSKRGRIRPPVLTQVMEKQLDIMIDDSLGGLQDHAEGDEVHTTTDGILKAGTSKRSRWSCWRICGIAMLVVAACAAVVTIRTVKNESALLKQGVLYSVSHLDEEDDAPQEEEFDPNNRDLANAVKTCKKRTAYAQGFRTERKAITACLKRLYARGCDILSCCVSSDGTYYDYWDGTYYSSCACGTSMLYDVCPGD